VQHAHAQPVVHERVEELHRPLDGLDEDEQRRPQPLAHHLAQRDELAVLAPAEDCSTVSAAAFFMRQLGGTTRRVASGAR
jgi:hypothetical protein